MRRQDILICVGASVLSAAAASAVTWFVGVRKVEKDYDARLDKEVNDSVEFVVKQMYKNVVVSDEDPDKVAEELEESSQTVEVEVVEKEETVEVVPLEKVDGERVFPNQDAKMSLEDLKNQNNKVQYHKMLQAEGYSETEEPTKEEVAAPDLGWDADDGISVISRDLFLENTSEYEQATLTFFVQDESVLDTDSELVLEHQLLIGGGRPPFGQMSEDENIVYIRNKNIQMEYEVIQDPGAANDFLMHSLADFYESNRNP